MTRKVTIEVWDKAKNPIADITRLANNRSMTLKLNGVGSFQFSVDLKAFEFYCAVIDRKPRSLLWPLNLDIIVKLDGQPWRGFEIAGVQPYLNKNDATLSVRCLSFLSLFSKRYVSGTYYDAEATSMATRIINLTQSQYLGDFGVTIGQQASTGVPRERQFEFKNVMDELVSLTRLETGQFDFDIDYKKEFTTHLMLGALRDDTPLRYGEGGNIEEVDVPTEGPSVSNKITGLGSGFGADQLRSSSGVGTDVTSILTYGLREELPQFNSVEKQAELNDNTAGFLRQVKDILQIPNVTTTSKHIDLLTLKEGDRFPVDLSTHAFTNNIAGLYRAYETTINWDDNDFADITIKFDDEGLDGAG